MSIILSVSNYNFDNFNNALTVGAYIMGYLAVKFNKKNNSFKVSYYGYIQYEYINYLKV